MKRIEETKSKKKDIFENHNKDLEIIQESSVQDNDYKTEDSEDFS